jgi:iron complex outermembrane receptor protein
VTSGTGSDRSRAARAAARVPLRLAGLAAVAASSLLGGAGSLAAQDSIRVGGVLEPIGIRATASPGAATRVLGEAELRGSRLAMLLDESFATVPGLHAQPRGTFALDTRLIVRGAGARSPFGVRGVTVVLDGVSQSLPDGQANLSQLDPGSLETVEIGRGAAAAAYGNAAGGVLLATSPSPFGRSAVRLRAGAGDDGIVAAALTVRRSLGAGGVVATASRVQQSGWRDYASGLLHQASIAAGGRRSGWLVSTRARVSDLVRAENPGALDSAQLAAAPRSAQSRNVAFHAGKTARELQFSAAARNDGEHGGVSAVTWYLARDLDNPLATGWVRVDRAAVGTRLAAERRLESALPLLVQLGADYQRMQDERANYANDSGRIGSVRLIDQTETVGSLGFRAAVTTLSPLAVALALRYDRVSFDVADHLVSDGDASGRRSLDAVSFTAALSRRSGAWTAHGSLRSSFETPTTTELARPGLGGLNPELGPQRGLQAEAGIAWEAGASRLSAAAYQTRLRDALVPREDTLAPGRFLFVNAALARLSGIEVEATTRLAAWLAAAAGATLTDFVYLRFPTDNGSFAGNRIPGVPLRSASARLTAAGTSGPLGEVELVHQGRAFADDANSAAAGAWTMLHLRGAWRWNEATARFGVRNALDRMAVGSLNVNGALRRFYEPAAGRTWYFGLEIASRGYLYR